jgi:ketosteroid isomerase-like protein
MKTAATHSCMRFLCFARSGATFLAASMLMASPDGHGQTSTADEAVLASAKRAILSVNADWVVAMRAGDAHRATIAYARDAIFVGRDGRVLAGHEEIEKSAGERIERGPTLVDGSLDDDGLQLAGALVYEWGHSALKWKTAEGKLQSTSGHFLTVWRQTPDAHWEIIRNLTL